MAVSTPKPIVLPLCSRDSTLEDLYRTLYGIRLFEESLLTLFDKGVLCGTTHTCIGQEYTAAGVVSALDRQRDIVFSNHRCHGHFLVYCGEVEKLYLELMGKPDGVCAGWGGSQHLHYRNFYSNGVQGGIVANAVGIALAEKLKNSGAVTVVFLGDGTLGEGVVYESFNLASLWDLPIVFVIDNNQFAQSTPVSMNLAGNVSDRPRAFRIPVEELSVREVEVSDILSQAAIMIDKARSQKGPSCLVLNTYRLAPHSKGDDSRSEAELKTAWGKDPLIKMRKRIAPSDIEKIENEISGLVKTAETRALSSGHYNMN